MWKCHGCLCNGDPGNSRCTGKPVATGTRDMVLLEFFLSSSSSAPVRTKPGSDIASLDHRDPGSSRCSGKLVTMSSEDMMLSESSSSLCHSKGFPGPSLLLGASGTPRCTLSGVFLYWPAASTNAGRERLQGWLCTLHVTHSSTLPPWLPGFPPEALPTVESSGLSPQAFSL